MQGVVIINTSRGGLVDSKAVIDSLKKKHIGGIGMYAPPFSLCICKG